MVVVVASVIHATYSRGDLATSRATVVNASAATPAASSGPWRHDREGVVVGHVGISDLHADGGVRRPGWWSGNLPGQFGISPLGWPLHRYSPDGDARGWWWFRQDISARPGVRVVDHAWVLVLSADSSRPSVFPRPWPACWSRAIKSMLMDCRSSSCSGFNFALVRMADGLRCRPAELLLLPLLTRFWATARVALRVVP